MSLSLTRKLSEERSINRLAKVRKPTYFLSGLNRLIGNALLLIARKVATAPKDRSGLFLETVATFSGKEDFGSKTNNDRLTPKMSDEMKAPVFSRSRKLHLIFRGHATN